MEANRPVKNLDELPLSPEEIKAIGEIELGPTKHEVFLNRHYKKLIYGGIALMLAASLAVSYYSYKGQQQQDAGSLIVQAARAASPSGAAAPDSYDSKALAEIAGHYADTASAPLSALMEALSLLADPAHAEKGIAQLESLAANGANELIRSRSAAALAAYYMRERKDGKAQEYWQKIIAMPLNPYTAIAYVSLGDMAHNAGDVESARNYYNQVVAATPNSKLAAEGIVGLRSLLLEVDAPKEIQKQGPPQPQANPLEGMTAPAAEDTQQLPFGNFTIPSGATH